MNSSKRELSLEVEDQLHPDDVEWMEHDGCLASDGVIDGRKLLKCINDMVGVRHLIEVHRLVVRGEIPLQYLDAVESITSGLRDLLVVRHSSPSKTDAQVLAVQKLLRPRRYRLPESVIQNIADHYYSSPQISRGSQLCLLMSRLGKIVQARDPSARLTTRTPVLLVSEIPEPSLILRSRGAARSYKSLLDQAIVHWNRNSTVQSLAIRIYLEELDRLNLNGTASIDARSLKRDLAVVRRWAKNKKRQLELGEIVYRGENVGEEVLEWPDHSTKRRRP